MPSGEALAGVRARPGSTLVLHLAITRTRTLAAELAESYGADCPVAVVANASQPSEVVLRGTLGDIADQVEAAGTAAGGGDPRRQGAGRGRTRGRVVPLRPGAGPFGQATLSHSAVFGGSTQAWRNIVLSSAAASSSRACSRPYVRSLSPRRRDSAASLSSRSRATALSWCAPRIRCRSCAASDSRTALFGRMGVATSAA